MDLLFASHYLHFDDLLQTLGATVTTGQQKQPQGLFESISTTTAAFERHTGPADMSGTPMGPDQLQTDPVRDHDLDCTQEQEQFALARRLQVL